MPMSVKDVKNIIFRESSATKITVTLLNTLKEIIDREGVKAGLNFTKEVLKIICGIRPSLLMFSNVLRLILQKAVSMNIKQELREYMINEIEYYINALKRFNKVIAEIACRRIPRGSTIFTFSFSSTILETLKYAKMRGMELKVYVSESRPGGEGRKLAEEIAKLGYEVTFFVNSAIRYFIKDVNLVLLGAEAIAANGAVIGKIGTSLITLIAKEARIPVYVLASTLKLSVETFEGALVPLGSGPASLIYDEEKAKKMGVKVYVPLVEASPPEHVDAIITERGVYPPQAVPILVREVFGWPLRVMSLDNLIREVEEKYVRS